MSGDCEGIWCRQNIFQEDALTAFHAKGQPWRMRKREAWITRKAHLQTAMHSFS